MKTYPLEFVINDQHYTANLLDVDLQELLGIFESGFDPKIPTTLISRAKLREVEQFLTDSCVTPPLPDLVKQTDFNDRMNLYKAIGALTLVGVKDREPTFELTPDQAQLIDEYKASLNVVVEVANADTSAE